ncbi:MAG: thioredoxin family protein [Bacilli bacterium]|nr:thioredoxin family protein [Bacilli bacterium]
MKKIILLIITSILLTGCLYKKPYVEINYEDFKEKIENKESFIFYIGATGCQYCEKYEKTLKRVVDKYDVEVFYIDTAEGKLTDDEKKGFEELVTFSGTPTTVFVREGEVQSKYNRIEGSVTSDKIIEAFERNGYIKEQ